MTDPTPPAALCSEVLVKALASGDLTGLAQARPMDRQDRFLTLLQVYDLHSAPLEVVGDAARFQNHPAVAELKNRLEADWLAELDAAWSRFTPEDDPSTTGGIVNCLKGIAVEERLPPAYRWLSRTAGWEQLVHFLALEGGPDGGFDDLVAICQVGLSGSAKLELGKNYWDEMGEGEAAAVHTELHHRMVEAIGLPRIPREELPITALERCAFGGLLATNRWLQPEMIGALGLTELQAGPRCRMVLQAFDRLGAPVDAYPFYAEHAEVDPVHGRDWVDKAVVPLVAQHPEWGARIVKGAWWRARLNLAFFEQVRQELAQDVPGDRDRTAA